MSWRRSMLSDVGIPKNLRDAGKEAAALKGMSFSTYVRLCMIEGLTKKD